MASHHAAYAATTSAAERNGTHGQHNSQQEPLSPITNLARRMKDYESVQTMFALCDVYAEVFSDESGGSCKATYVPGVLAVVEKGRGVFVEWKPSRVGVSNGGAENDSPPGEGAAATEDWVIEGDGEGGQAPQPERRPASTTAPNNNSLIFSADVKEIRSYVHDQPRKHAAPAATVMKWNIVKFICRDGTASNSLQFRGGGYPAFVDCLQRYAILNRSAREDNLVLLADSREDALKKSLGSLGLMGPDRTNFVSRFMSNPYATSLTALSKLTTLVLDPESLISESQLREQLSRSMLAMRGAAGTEEETEKLRSHNDEAGFEHVFQLELPTRPKITGRDAPVTREVWDRFRSPKDGHIADSHALRSLIFRGGVEPAMRATVWKYMLGYYKWAAGDEENARMRKQREEEYYRMKLQWMSMSDEQERRFADFRERKALIEKDVARTDRSHPFFSTRHQSSSSAQQQQSGGGNLQLLKDLLMTYVMFNFDLGYVQGMSDFLSPLLVVMDGDEVDTFWAFVGLMERVQDNFAMDQVHIRKQLGSLRSLLEIVNPRFANYLESHESEHMYFCFRWILVHFKREFSFNDTMYLWEVLWTEIPCKNFLLLFCVAILDGQMNYIIENGFGLAGILKHINGLSMRIDLEPTVRTAEAIYHQLAAVQDKLPRHICEILGFTIDENGERTMSPA